MTLLVTVSDVIESMGMNPELEEDLDPAVSRAIVVAQTRLESEIGSGLERLLNKDTFKADSDLFSGTMPSGFLIMRLNHGFVATLVAVKSCSAFNGTFSDIPSTEYKLDAKKGLVFLSPLYDGQFVEVEYRSGFLSASTTPNDVKQAILYFVPGALKIAQPVDPEKKKTADENGNLAQGLLRSLLRRFNLSFVPLYSESVVSSI